jgi:DNA-binding CsgD family transcriptional regulator
MPSQTDILNALFAAASGIGPGGDVWGPFLELLGRETRAGLVTLQLDRQGLPTQHWRWRHSETGAVPAPLSPTDLTRMRSHRIYNQDDLPAETALPGALRAMKAPLGTGGAGGAAVVTLYRTGEDFRAIDGMQLSALAPYLAPAMTTWVALTGERQRARLGQDMLRDLGAGWMMLSAHGLLLDIDPGLRAPLTQIGGVRVAPDGWLGFRDETTAQAFRQALSAALSGALSEAGAGRASFAVRLSDAPLMELRITAKDQPQQPGAPLLIGWVRYAQAAADLPLSHVISQFGLSRSEARLAVLLCDGHSLSEAARQLGWTIETARSTSKQVFARMGVRGQTGVIRRMQSGALWLGVSGR